MVRASKYTLLARKKPEALRRYLAMLAQQDIPPHVKIPEDPREALRLGMRLAAKQGYEAGLVDGVEMGIEVTESVLDTLILEGSGAFTTH